MPTKDFPSYLFLGEEDFLKEQLIEKLKSDFLDNRTVSLNYSVFYAKDKDFDIKEMLDTLNTLPFLSKRRLVVLKDAESLSPTAKDSVLSYLSHPKDSSIFIIESKSTVIKGEFLLEISKNTRLVYNRRLTESGMVEWLTKKAALSKKRISKDALEVIKENLPNDLRTLSSNMDNIVLYTEKKPLITKHDVETLIGISPSHTAFDLLDSLEKKDVKKALRIFSVLKKDRKKETELLGLLAWNARMLLRIKEFLSFKDASEIRQSIPLSPRQFNRIVHQASGFKMSQIRTLLDEILKADVDIKSGSSPRIVMERLIVRMCM